MVIPVNRLVGAVLHLAGQVDKKQNKLWRNYELMDGPTASLVTQFGDMMFSHYHGVWLVG